MWVLPLTPRRFLKAWGEQTSIAACKIRITNHKGHKGTQSKCGTAKPGWDFLCDPSCPLWFAGLYGRVISSGGRCGCWCRRKLPLTPWRFLKAWGEQTSIAACKIRITNHKGHKGTQSKCGTAKPG